MMSEDHVLVRDFVKWAKGDKDANRARQVAKFEASLRSHDDESMRHLARRLDRDVVTELFRLAISAFQAKGGKTTEDAVFDLIDSSLGFQAVVRGKKVYAPFAHDMDGMIVGDYSDLYLSITNSSRERKEDAWPQEIQRLETFRPEGRNVHLYCVQRDPPLSNKVNALRNTKLHFSYVCMQDAHGIMAMLHYIREMKPKPASKPMRSASNTASKYLAFEDRDGRLL